MWERLTERAKRAVTAAREEAVRLHSDCVSTEHLLLGLCREPESKAVHILNKMGVDIEVLIAEIERQAQPGSSTPPANEIAFTPSAKKVLELAVDEARRMNHNYIGTEHFLLGLIEEGEGMAAKVLLGMKVDLKRAREEVTALHRNQGPDVAIRRTAPSSKNRGGMWEWFSVHSCNIVHAACEEAVRLHSEQVNSQHLLLGLCRIPESAAVRALLRAGVDIDALARAIEHQTTSGPTSLEIDEIKLTPRAKKVLALAVAEARRMNQNHLGTEHVLWALLRGGGGKITNMLKEVGADLERVKRQAARSLGIRESEDCFASSESNMSDNATEQLSARGQFTERAKNVLNTARKVAIRLGSNCLRSEYLLLALCRDGENSAVLVLENLGVDIAVLTKEVERQLKLEPALGADAQIIFTPRTRRVLSMAMKEARLMNHKHVGTEHLLLGLLREGEGMAAKVLLGMHINFDRVQDEVLRLMGD